MRVVIIGGGVAGATAAIALRRSGAEVTVYEAYPDPAGPVGSFVSLASNGLRGLAAVGGLERIQRIGIDVARQRMWSGTGRSLGDVARARPAADPLHSVTLRRAELVAELRVAAEESGAPVNVGRRLITAESTSDGVRAGFEDGHRVEADLLVGADGLWSTVRRLLDANAPTPTYAGLYTVSGTSTGVPVEPGVFNMVFGRSGAFIYLAARDGAVWWSAQIAEPNAPDPAGVDLDVVAQRFRHEAVPSTILRAADQVEPAKPYYQLGRVPLWHNDRMVLLGDAAHPVGAGQGASMAIEDAVVLAQRLRATPSVPAALRDFDAARRPRITKMLKAGDDNRDAKTAGPVARRIRDIVMPIVFRHFYEKATGWLYAYDIGELPGA
jgi:salicylate hydroxylase